MMRKIFVIREINDDDEIEFEWYCRSRRTRKKLYEKLRIIDNQDHYRSWLDLRGLKMSRHSWSQYLEDVNPDPYKYEFDVIVVNKWDIRYNEFSYEEACKAAEVYA